MNELVETVKSGLTFLADLSVRAAAVALLGWTVVRLMRGRSAAARHALCLGVLAGLFLMPVMRLALPGVYLEQASAEAAAAAVLPRLPAVGAASSGAGATNVAVRDSRIPAWPLPLAAAYLAVAGTMLLRSALRVRRAWRNAEAGAVIRDTRITDLLSEVSLRQGRGFPLPGLRECDISGVPHALGWRQALIVLPVGWREWDEFRLRAVLAHEVAHVRRGDWAAMVAASVYRSLFWFHPAAWWVERELAAFAEEACDACALAESGDDRRYAAVLLVFATVMTGEAVPATAMARGSKIGARIERILSGGWKQVRPLGPKSLAALAACTLPLMLGAAMLRPGQEPVQPSTGLQRSELDPLSHRAIPGARMTPAEASECEVRIQRNPHDLEARAKWLGYLYSNGLKDLYLAQLLWLIENHPEAAVHNTYPAAQPGLAGIVTADEFSKVQHLWRRKAAEYPANADVLLHAGQFLERADRAEARRHYLAARSAAPEDARPLGLLVDLARRDLWRLSSGPSEAEGPAHEALQEILSSSDGAYVQAVAQAFCPPQATAESEVPAGLRHKYENTRNACQDLFARAAALGAPLAFAPQPAAQMSTSQAPPPQRISVGGAVQQSLLLHKVEPEYPPLARQAQLSGVVKFNVIIDREGNVSNLTLVSGHPLLVQSAMDAVRQYKYRPTLLNGQPVEVVSTVDVGFIYH